MKSNRPWPVSDSALTVLFLIAPALVLTSTAYAAPPPKPRVIVMTDSSTIYVGFCPTERATVQDLHNAMEIFRTGGVDTYGHAVYSRWQAIYDSKVVEVVGNVTAEGVRPPEHTHYWANYVTVRNFIEDGIEVPQVIAEACHQRGMSP